MRILDAGSDFGINPLLRGKSKKSILFRNAIAATLCKCQMCSRMTELGTRRVQRKQDQD
jgi:hypothetical protein